MFLLVLSEVFDEVLDETWQSFYPAEIQPSLNLNKKKKKKIIIIIIIIIITVIVIFIIVFQWKYFL